MEDHGWDRILDAIDTRYGIDQHGKETRPLEDRPDLNETVHFITFERSGEEYRLERISRPAIIEKRSHYHKASTGGTRHENVYDPGQLTHKTVLSHKEAGEWVEIDPDQLGV